MQYCNSTRTINPIQQGVCIQYNMFECLHLYPQFVRNAPPSLSKNLEKDDSKTITHQHHLLSRKSLQMQAHQKEWFRGVVKIIGPLHRYLDPLFIEHLTKMTVET